ncbi:NPD-domain-containing protein [Fistulina hepatica ATCC 64428]|uniref:NPD-domain-containing protein n=1 Tax=Fistulina hepatica ATCC 64428 TaxID=1128425 RepID=A0A0D7ANK2_9AGAR|nr:NPD-domain-containing protein [Fistulina hepatica ATCC 64428]
MAGGSGGALAAQCSLGGGFGFIAAGYDDPDALASEIGLARTQLGLSADQPVPVGVGFFGWKLDKSPAEGEAQLRTALQNRVRAIWLAFGSDLGRWVAFVRAYDQANHARTIIFIQTSSPDEAYTALNDWGVDFVVAQGIEAGGHGPAAAPPVLTLIEKMRTRCGPEAPILAAGGIVTGAQVADVLAKGACGAVLGTRFLVSPESLYSNKQRDALIRAASEDTVRSKGFDAARGTLDWPAGIDGRGLRNKTIEDYENGVSMPDLQKEYRAAAVEGDTSRIIVWAGSGVGHLRTIQPAKEIMINIREEYARYHESA